MAKLRMIKVDRERLYEELRKVGLGPGEASVRLGFGASYISSSSSRGHLSRLCVRLLEKELGIAPDQYVIQEETAPEPEVEEIQAVEEVREVIDYDRLHNVIYDAVYLAVKKAWAE